MGVRGHIHLISQHGKLDGLGAELSGSGSRGPCPLDMGETIVYVQGYAHASSQI